MVKNKVKNILVISSYLTQKTSPRGFQCEYILKLLSEDYNIIILTNQKSNENKSSLKKIYPKAKDIIIIYSNLVSRIIFVFRKIIGRLLLSLQVFDIESILFSKKSFMTIYDKYQIDIILSFSSPISDHILGLKARRIFIKASWITFFSDLIKDSPFLIRTPLDRMILDNIEKTIAVQSDKIICPSKKMINIINKRYHFSKAKYIPHMFLNYHKSKKRSCYNQTFILRHIGSLYARRSPEILLKTVIKLNKVFDTQNKKIVIEFIGRAERICKNLILRYSKKYPYIKYVSPVPKKRADHLKKTSDCLVVLDVNMKQSPFFLSKIPDYFSYQKPILGITTKGSEVERVLKMTGHMVAYYHDISSIINIVKPFIINRKKGDYKFKETDKFKKDIVYKQWKNVINS